jgi:hypothetical protein
MNRLSYAEWREMCARACERMLKESRELEAKQMARPKPPTDPLAAEKAAHQETLNTLAYVSAMAHAGHGGDLGQCRYRACLRAAAVLEVNPPEVVGRTAEIA